jgi:YD repeat-containing protein
MNAKRLLAVIGVVVLAFGCSMQTVAQTAYTPNVSNVGLPENGVFSGGSIDSVQLANGNLHVDIPLLHLPGIGMDTDIHFVYDNQLFSITPTVSGTVQYPINWYQITIGRNGFSQVSDPLQGVLKIGQHTENWQSSIALDLGYPSSASNDPDYQKAESVLAQYEQEYVQVTGCKFAGTLTHMDYMAFTDSNGTGHSFPVYGYLINPSNSCMGSGTPVNLNTSTNSFAEDASGYNLIIDPNTGAVDSLTDKHGTKYTLAAGSGGSGSVGAYLNPNGVQITPEIAPTVLSYQQATQVEDSNGNIISAGNCSGAYCFTDTVGRTITETGGGPNSGINIPLMTAESNANEPTAISYIDQNGIKQTITINYAPFTLDLVSLCGGKDSCGPQPLTFAANSVVNLPTSIVLQNGDTYTFTYLVQNSSYCTGCTLGEIQSITLPTGGTIQYTWGALTRLNSSGSELGRQVLSRTVTVNGQSSTWNYQYTYPESNSIVTDPNKNDTVYTFNGGGEANLSCAAYGPVAIKEVSYNGSQFANSPIATKTMGYQGGGCGIGPESSSVLTWNSAGVTTATYTEYDIVDMGNGYAGSRGNIVGRSVNDYGTPGSGSPGASLSTTTYSYLHDTNPAYAAANIADRVSQVQVYNQSALASLTNITYDNFIQTAQSALTSPGWTTNHDNTNYGTKTTLRGLPTKVQKCSGPVSGTPSTSCASTITTYTNYNTLGQPTLSIDGNSNSTYIAYTNVQWPLPPANTNSGSAFLITTTAPTTTDNPSGIAVSHVTKQYQDVNTGLVIAKSDQNGNLTTQTYDCLMRPLVTARPDGGSTTISYGPAANNSSNPCTQSQNPNQAATNQIQTKILESSSSSKVSTTTLDGMGRKISQSTATTPFDAKCGSLTVDTTYDALSRVSFVSNPYCIASQSTDGLTQYTYDAIGRLITKTNPDGSAQNWSFNGNIVKFTDEDGNPWTRTYNAESWLTQVLEPSGLETDYAYDSLGNLLQVDQCGGACPSASDHVRKFAYDVAGRLITSYNPETGTISYSYDLNSNLAKKTDNRGIVINYSYDQLNRLYSKTYSDSTPPVSFLYDTSLITTTNSPNLRGELTQATEKQVRQSWPRPPTTITMQWVVCNSSSNARQPIWPFAASLLTKLIPSLTWAASQPPQPSRPTRQPPPPPPVGRSPSAIPMTTPSGSPTWSAVGPTPLRIRPRSSLLQPLCLNTVQLAWSMLILV